MARVEFTEDALESLRRQDAWLGERNPSAAKRLRADIERVATLLGEHPLAGPAVEGRPYRTFTTSRYRYRLMYLVHDDVVEIIDVLHPRQSGPSE